MSGKVVYDIILEIKIKGELLFQRKHRKIGRGEIHITKALYFLESTTLYFIFQLIYEKNNFNSKFQLFFKQIIV